MPSLPTASRRRQAVPAPLVAALLGAAALVGCGGDNSSDGTGGASAPSTTGDLAAAPSTTDAPATTAAATTTSDAPTATEAPTTTTTTADAEPGPFVAGDYSLTDVSFEEDRYGFFAGSARAENIGPDKELACVIAYLYRGDELVGQLDASRDGFRAGSTITLEFGSTDKFEEFDRFEFEVEAGY